VIVAFILFHPRKIFVTANMRPRWKCQTQTVNYDGKKFNKLCHDLHTLPDSSFTFKCYTYLAWGLCYKPFTVVRYDCKKICLESITWMHPYIMKSSIEVYFVTTVGYAHKIFVALASKVRWFLGWGSLIDKPKNRVRFE
jgi:hypothetical protein